MQTTGKATVARSENAHAEPMELRKRIGSTDFVISVRFSESATEAIEDKILRLIESEVRKSA